MFTGIIEEVGTIDAVTPLNAGARFRVTCGFASTLAVDESVAVDGVCLTVVTHDDASFEAVAVEETLARSTLGSRRAGDGVNLERALRVGGRLDGHLVQGHVDGSGEIREVRQRADSHEVRIAYPAPYAAFLVEKGSVAVDGVSLTVSRLDEPRGTFEVAVIPHTWQNTIASRWTVGSGVNLEFDLVGKYVLRARQLG